jgi:hypothetical protein
MAILEQAARPPRPFNAKSLLAEIRRLGVATPDEAVALVREDRDSR